MWGRFLAIPGCCVPQLQGVHSLFADRGVCVRGAPTTSPVRPLPHVSLAALLLMGMQLLSCWDSTFSRGLMIFLDIVFIMAFMAHALVSYYVTRIAYDHLQKFYQFEGRPMQETMKLVMMAVMMALFITWVIRLPAEGFNYTKFLRPVLLITSSITCQKAVAVFIDTLIDMKVMFLLLTTIVATVATAFALLFKGIFSDAAFDLHTVDSFLDSTVDMFMFMVSGSSRTRAPDDPLLPTQPYDLAVRRAPSAGDNYPELTAPAFVYSTYYVLFFGPVAFFGVFVIMAVVIGAFEESFDKYAIELVSVQTRLDCFVRATVFALWTFPPEDAGQDQVLSEHDFLDLLQGVAVTRKLSETMQYSCFMLMDRDQSGTIDFEEFDSYFIVANIVGQAHSQRHCPSPPSPVPTHTVPPSYIRCKPGQGRPLPCSARHISRWTSKTSRPCRCPGRGTRR